MNLMLISDLVLSYVNRKTIVSGDEIVELIKGYDPSFKDIYKNIVLKALRDRGIIYSYDVNIYKAYRDRIQYVPKRDFKVERLLCNYRGNGGFYISYFDSSLFNEFCSLQSMTRYLFVGVESYAVNYMIDKMEKNNKKAITSNDFARLNRMYRGINFDFDYVIKPISVDAPLFLTTDNGFRLPKLETLLVDLVSDKTLREMYSFNAEMIFKRALQKYAIKINTLIRYAIKKDVKDFVSHILMEIGFDIKKGEFNDRLEYMLEY